MRRPEYFLSLHEEKRAKNALDFVQCIFKHSIRNNAYSFFFAFQGFQLLAILSECFTVVIVQGFVNEVH